LCFLHITGEVLEDMKVKLAAKLAAEREEKARKKAAKAASKAAAAVAGGVTIQKQCSDTGAVEAANGGHRDAGNREGSRGPEGRLQSAAAAGPGPGALALAAAANAARKRSSPSPPEPEAAPKTEPVAKKSKSSAVVPAAASDVYK
jgi:hypothetical protein